jgi:hypothetical protein
MSLQKQLTKIERKVATVHPDSDIEKIKLWYYQADSEALLNHDKRIELTEGQEQKRKKLEIIWGLLIDQPRADVINRITKDYGITDRHAHNLISQSFELFGSIDKIRKESVRALYIAQREAEIKAIKESNNIEETDKYKLIHINRERIEKMSDVDNHDDLSMEEILDALQMPDVTRSTNPDTLDTEHEVVEED